MSVLSFRKRCALASAAMGMALALSACGGGGGGSSDDVASAGGEKKPSADAPQKEKSPEEMQKARLKYASCMREQGIDMPDPDADGQQVAQPADAKKFQAAVDKCKQFMPNADGQAPGYSPEQKAKDVKLAQCLRGKGVEAEDPTADGMMNIPNGDSQKTQDALKACGAVSSGKAGQ
ncbi:MULTISPECIES: hypothetical protein [unclassified Streptomyces]|uniref:hypothetical protein n=1 Tax=unclassified Streptomyces TaxID=2593676 RepID=UPI00226D62AD|nr:MULTISPECIES: hypothetical protein [unclassified Streptomyces]MCY0924085.1 hypothetical protein [Streptomyces sp. H27-G5]MCY0963136.1 hypothetical protein [Streptomyces sp. H27-H5]